MLFNPIWCHCHMNGSFILVIAAATSLISIASLLAFWPIASTNAQSANIVQEDSNNATTGRTTTALPIPDGKRMFTPDGADISRASSGNLTVEMVHTPKELIAGRPAKFILNLFSADGTWLWHSDYKISIVEEASGQEILTMPNIHGHGSIAQFTYTFPSAGKYEINVISGQQVGSPNYSGPKTISESRFTVNVSPQEEGNTTSSATKASTVREIPVTVSSWSFSPNVIEVNKGDLVRLVFTTGQDEVPLYNGHGFGIEGYNINVFLVKGTTQTVEFEADKAGTFVFRCTSFCVSNGPEDLHFNMTGTLVVHE